MNDLAKLSLDRLARAHDVLGHKPGPGIDIRIIPSNPISSIWTLQGITPCGTAFIHKFWPEAFVEGNPSLSRLKTEALDWGLTFRVDWSNALEPKVD